VQGGGTSANPPKVIQCRKVDSNGRWLEKKGKISPGCKKGEGSVGKSGGTEDLSQKSVRNLAGEGGKDGRSAKKNSFSKSEDSNARRGGAGDVRRRW